MKNNKLFQYVVIGIFVFFIVVGAILFATYRSKNQANSTISISVWGTISSDVFETFSARFFSSNDLKFDVNYKYADPSVFADALVEAIASGDGPDAVVLSQDMIVRFSNKIYAIPYTVLPELNFKQTYIQAGEMFLSENGVLALPLSVDPLVMYWNRDIFNNSGITNPPQTWPDLINLTTKLTKRDQSGNLLKNAVALGEYRNVENAKEIISTLFLQTGNKIVSRYNGETAGFVSSLKTANDSSATLGLQFFTNFSNPVRPEYSWNRSMPNSLTTFASGDLAMYFGFASEFLKIKELNPNLNFDVAIVPQIKDAEVYTTFGNVLGLAILKSSANPAGTYAVLNSVTSDIAVPYWQEKVYLPSARRGILAQKETNSVKDVFNRSAIISKGWYDPDYNKTSEIFREMVELYTTGQETLTEAVAVASERLNNLLK